MSFTVSSLTAYVDQNSTDLLARLYFEKRSSDYFTPQSGVKQTQALQLLAVTAIPQDGTSCTATASGDVTFTQRNITVKPITYFDTFCMKTLIGKWTQTQLAAGANAETETMPFEEQITGTILKRIQEIDEVQDWQGDTTSGSVYLNKYDGLIKTIDAASGVIDGNTASVTSITSGGSGNAVDVINAMINARSKEMKTKENQVLFCGYDVFDKYVDTLRAKNLYHVDATAWEDYTIKVPGKNVTLVGVAGLDGTDRMFLGTKENFFLGFDLAGDEEQFRVWYSEDDDLVKYRVKYKRGLQVAYPTEIVQFELAV